MQLQVDVDVLVELTARKFTQATKCVLFDKLTLQAATDSATQGSRVATVANRSTTDAAAFVASVPWT